MSNITPLNAVLRRIEKKEELMPNEVLVELDTKTGMSSTKPSNVFSKLFSNIQKYAVSTEHVAVCRGTSYRLNNAITLEVSFEASIPTGNEKKVVESLYKGATPEEVLNNNIRNWAADFVRSNEDQMLDLSRDLENYIAETSLRTIGMHLKVDVKYKGNVEPITIKSDGGFAVRVTDYDQQVFVRFEVELLVSDKTTALLNAKRSEDLQKTFTNTIREYFHKNVSLQQYCFELDLNTKDAIWSLFDKLTKPLGRTVGFLALTADSVSTLLPSPNISTFEHLVQADIKGYQSKITVKNKTLFELSNIGKFKASKIANLETWFRQTITTIVRDTLFDLTYKELLLNRYQYEQQIRNQIFDKADTIGYQIKQHIVIPDLVELKLITEGVKADFSESFVTSDTHVSIKLQVYVRGRFEEESLQELDERYMAPTANINKAIEDAIKDRIEENVHGIDPEQMYVRFEDFEGGKNSVRTRLEGIIKELLIEEFKVSRINLTVNLKQKDNELTRKIAELTLSTRQFSLDFKPLTGKGEEIQFDVRYKISSVSPEGWGLFQKNLKKTVEVELKEIENVLSENLNDILASIPFDYLISTDVKVKNDLKRGLNQKVFQVTSREFGLLIELVTFNRHLTVFERETLAVGEFNIINRAQIDKDSSSELNTFNKDRLLSLYKKRESVFEIGDDDEISRIDKEIENIEKKLSTESFDASSTRQMYLDAGSKKSFSFDDLYTGLSLNEGVKPEETE
jgi:hypothetical protein